MKRFVPCAGLLFLLVAGSAHAQNLGGLQLYETMHTMTLQEQTLQNVDPDIISYVVALARQDDMLPANLQADPQEIVKAAFETRLNDFCEMYGATIDACAQTYQMFRDWGRDIMDTRTLTKDLLHIAAGYETGVSGNMGEVFTIAERTLTTRNLWRSQDDALLTPEVFPQVRAIPRPDSVTDSMLDELETAVKESAPISVWRYRYGIAAFDKKEECSDGETGSSELFEAVEERFCNVEKKLREIRDALPSDVLTFDPPLQRGEIVIFPLRRMEESRAVVWMMAENVNGTVVRDVGLGWQLMLDPAPIGILGGSPCDAGEMGDAYCNVVNDYMIRPGGRYADPPVEPAADEAGICQLPFARDGYLCRPMRHDRCNAEIEDKDPASIVLTECKPSQANEPVAITESGPDVCRTGWWRIPSDKLKNMERPSDDEDGPLPPDSTCSPCRIDARCKDDCLDGASAVTEPKDDNGVIHICINRGAPRSILRTNIIHEMVHAQQLCGQPPHTNLFDTAERCCANEMEANTVSCRVLAEDGILDEAGVSIEECMGGLANVSCSRFGEKVCSALGTEDAKDKIEEALKRKEDESGNDSPSCDEVGADWMKGMAKLDSRILSMIEGLNGACSPGCPTKYENTIGNNLCYVGQCIEQSIEQSRVIPGRMPLVVGDEAYPWDSCAATNTQAGGLITLPAISPPLIPAYNPQLLVESLDRALCQLNGLPSLTPPILCQFDYKRRLSIPTDSYLSTALSFTSQIEENDSAVSNLQRMTQSIATRIGTSMLTRYLSWAGPALSDTLRTANQLLNSMEKTKFPLETCPRSSVEKPNFCTAAE